MAIYCVTGKPRHGKTYWLTTMVCDMLNAGERVFSNVKINTGVGALKKIDESIVGDIRKKEDLENTDKKLFYWTNLHEWEHMSNGNIIADEGTRYFNARQWAMLSPETEIKLQQHGKEDLDVWVATQHYTRIDVTLRVLVEKFFIVETVLGNVKNKKPFLGLKRFKITGLELEDIDAWYRMRQNPDLNLELDEEIFYKWLRKKYAMCFDTRQQVGFSENMPLVHKTRTCPICHKQQITHL